MDWSERRDYDVPQSFKKWMFPAIALYFTISMGIYFGFEFLTSMGVLEAFYLWFFMTGLLGFIFIFGAGKKQDMEMEMSHHGYNTQDKDTKPFFLFGSQEYKRYRVDTGGFQGMRMGFDPFADKLDELEKRQREMDCKVCADEIGYDGGYFIETRKLYRVCGFPVREEHLDTEPYCSNHKPRDFV